MCIYACSCSHVRCIWTLAYTWFCNALRYMMEDHTFHMYIVYIIYNHQGYFTTLDISL